ncbi:PREDICTED: transmembrane protein 154 [Miniopterus natalensis]|uniref:transmembrane protein 154 n=1 Tax=Miniopterus natalensis TaxID=291302 RepID=UPI0007A6C0D6|nr:PREDICTED: transmembrane protein 154 [Miniopterus natalensis]
MPEGEPRRADMKAPRAALIFALLLALLPTGRAQEYNETTEDVSADERQEMELTDEDATIISTVVAVTTETFIENTNSTLIDEEDHQLEFILMVLIPVALLALLLLSVVFIVINYKRKKAKEELPSSQGSQSALQTYEQGSDNLKVPIFEEDTPSVMEIEMEELDKWMNMHRNANSECLPPLKEEKEPNHNPSDNEP